MQTNNQWQDWTIGTDWDAIARDVLSNKRELQVDIVL